MTVNAPPENFWVEKESVRLQSLEQLKDSGTYENYRLLVELILGLGPSRVLDLGCYTGSLASVLISQDFDGTYVGYDLCDKAITLASEEDFPRGYHFETKNIRELDDTDNSFPCVVLKDVVEHLECYKSSLSQAFRVASDYVVVSSHISWEQLPPKIEQSPAGFYLNRYNKRTVSDYALTQGFTLSSFIPENDNNQMTAVFTRTK